MSTVEIHRICEHCNKEYLLMSVNSSNAGQACVNMTTCPNCEVRDDPWIRVEVKHQE